MTNGTKKTGVVIAFITGIIVIIYTLIRNWKMKARGMRNNNPFNVRSTDDQWLGKIGVDDKGFCIFSALEYGIRAGLVNLYNGYFSKNLDLRAIISKYAPASENDVEAYLNSIRKMTGIYSDIIPKSSEWLKIAWAIMKHEQGKEVVTVERLREIAKFFNLIHYS